MSEYGSCAEMAEHVIALQLDILQKSSVAVNLLRIIASKVENDPLASPETKEKVHSWVGLCLREFLEKCERKGQADGIEELAKRSREFLGCLSTRLTVEEERRKRQGKMKHNQVTHRGGQLKGRDGLPLVRPMNAGNRQAGR